MEQTGLPWLLQKIARLWQRLLARDFIRNRAKMIKPPAGVSTPAYAIAYNRHGGYCVPLSMSHRPPSRYIMGGRVWEEDTVNYIVDAVGDGDIVHAGAFFGDCLPPLANALKPGALVWAFEPNDINFKAAEMTLAINEMDNVKLFKSGLGPTSSKAKLIVENKSGLALGSASFIAEEDGGAKSEDIVIEAMDSVIPDDRRVSVIHLDIEGFEEQALDGALKILQRDRPILVLETPPSDAWFDQHLKPLGYGVDRKLDWNTVFIAKES